MSKLKCLLVIFKAVINLYIPKLNENDFMIINNSKHLVAYLIPELGFISLIKVLDIHEIHAYISIRNDHFDCLAKHSKQRCFKGFFESSTFIYVLKL